MKKYFLLALVVLTGIASSCKYDDDEVWDSVNNLADRVTNLETLTKQMNSDIVAMQGIVNAMQKGLTVTEVEELADGYILHFSDGTKATIKNGADGKDGANGSDGKDGADGENGKDGKDGKDAPVVGVAQDNGVYYWTMTIDGKTEWLTDEDGNKMPVSGADGEDGKDGSSSTGSTGAAGKDGVTPVVTIVNGYWYINDVNTNVQAVGKNGQDGDSMFQSVAKDGDVLKITLTTENKVYELPLAASVSYEINGKELEGNVVTVAPGSSVALTYTVNDMTGHSVEIIKEEGVTVAVSESTLTITPDDNTTEGKVVILYYNANKTITSVLDVQISTTIESDDNLQTALSQGGTVVLSDDMAVSEELTITKNVVLDLNEKTLTGYLKVTDGCTLTVKNGTIAASSGKDAISIAGAADDQIVVNIESGATVTSETDCCIVVPGGNNSVNITINVEGKLKTNSQNYAALQANGNTEGLVVNVKEGSSIESENNTGIYFPCKSKLNIYGGTIKGNTAVYMKSGELNISGGNLEADGEMKTFVHGVSGCQDTGDALVIEACNYPQGIPVVSITGGTFKSKNAKAIGYYQQSNEYKLANEQFITGGTFSDPSACYYLGENADVTIEMTADYNGGGFTTESGQKVTLNMDENVVYTAVAPLVGSAGTQNLGFQFKKGSTVSIKGGKITSSVAKMLINNYADLTLEGVELSAAIPNEMNNQAYYVLSNNCGTVNINNGTVITAPTSTDAQKVFAFDVCKYASYPNVTVNVNSGATIKGNVEYTGQLENDNTTTKQLLNVNSGATIKGNLVVADQNKAAAAVGVKVDAKATVEGEGWDLN